MRTIGKLGLVFFCFNSERNILQVVSIPSLFILKSRSGKSQRRGYELQMLLNIKVEDTNSNTSRRLTVPIISEWSGREDQGNLKIVSSVIDESYSVTLIAFRSHTNFRLREEMSEKTEAHDDIAIDGGKK